MPCLFPNSSFTVVTSCVHCVLCVCVYVSACEWRIDYVLLSQIRSKNTLKFTTLAPISFQPSFISFVPICRIQKHQNFQWDVAAQSIIMRIQKLVLTFTGEKKSHTNAGVCANLTRIQFTFKCFQMEWNGMRWLFIYWNLNSAAQQKIDSN